MVLSGCPGSLSNPDAFGDGDTEIGDAESIFANKCTDNCHDET